MSERYRMIREPFMCVGITFEHWYIYRLLPFGLRWRVAGPADRESCERWLSIKNDPTPKEPRP